MAGGLVWAGRPVGSGRTGRTGRAVGMTQGAGEDSWRLARQGRLQRWGTVVARRLWGRVALVRGPRERGRRWMARVVDGCTIRRRLLVLLVMVLLLGHRILSGRRRHVRAVRYWRVRGRSVRLWWHRGPIILGITGIRISMRRGWDRVRRRRVRGRRLLRGYWAWMFEDDVVPRRPIRPLSLRARARAHVVRVWGGRSWRLLRW